MAATDAAVLAHALRRGRRSTGSAAARSGSRPPSRSSSSSATARSAPARCAACRSSPDLRAEGFAIWPFDAAGTRTALEIYPSALRRLVPDARPFAGNDERDAVCSALRHVGAPGHARAPRRRDRSASRVSKVTCGCPRLGCYFALRSSMSCGTTLCTSPTMPRSATEKIGASASLFTATMLSLFFMPTRCWVAPEMPSAM